MAQHRGRSGEWPRANETTGAGRNAPTGHFQTADAILRSDRQLAGPLRMGTAPGVGPRGRAVAVDRVEAASDFGMDRVDPREFDPMGTSLNRYPERPSSELLSREIRGGPRRRD
jgi:hypothetical protein